MGRAWSIPLFRVFGIRLEMHITFVLILAYAAWMGSGYDGARGAAWSVLLVALLFVCVVLHELGHSLTARLYGIPTHRILLLPIGGMAQLAEMPREPWREFFITAAGPAVNVAIVLLIGVPLWAAGLVPTTEQEILSVFRDYTPLALALTLLVYNVIMAVFNLIPVFPMDGGRIFRSLLAMRLSYLHATRVAAWVAKPLAAAGAIYALIGPGHILLALLFAFIYIAGDMEYRMVERQERFRDQVVGDLTARFVRTVPGHLSIEDALWLMQHEQPREIVVQNGGGPVRILTPGDLRRAARELPHSTSLDAIAPRPSIHLQAGWPFGVLSKELARRTEDRFAVYNGTDFLGILRCDDLERAADWERLRTTPPDTTPSRRGWKPWG